MTGVLSRGKSFGPRHTEAQEDCRTAIGHGAPRPLEAGEARENLSIERKGAFPGSLPQMTL